MSVREWCGDCCAWIEDHRHSPSCPEAGILPASPAPVGDGLVERLEAQALAIKYTIQVFPETAGWHTRGRLMDDLNEAAARITRLEQRERELVEGLKFYANSSNYDIGDGEHQTVNEDKGAVARALIGDML